MITYEQALVADVFHDESIPCIWNGRSNRWRRNGVTKTWKTRPGEFRIPVKFGMYGYGYIDHNNAGQFHIYAECPLHATTDPLTGKVYQ